MSFFKNRCTENYESLPTILNKTLACKVKCLFEKDVLSYVHKVHKVCYMYFL
jgi:hypothetical protein